MSPTFQRALSPLLLFAGLAIGVHLTDAAPDRTTSSEVRREERQRICVVAHRGALVGGGCTVARPHAHAPARARRAVGAPVCWWRANADRLSDVRGVGPRVARALVDYRDNGGSPDAERLVEVEGVGPTLAAAIAEGVDTDCGRAEPRSSSQRAASRRGLRETQRVQ